MTNLVYPISLFVELESNRHSVWSDFTISEDTIEAIKQLTMEVTHSCVPQQVQLVNADTWQKKKHNKAQEVSDADWDTLKSFQVTRIEHKTGIEGQIDTIRSYLNKMTDKTYKENLNKICVILDEINIPDVDENSDGATTEESTNSAYEHLKRFAVAIFEMASKNKFYSRVYANLFSDLTKKYPSFDVIFQESLSTFKDKFRNNFSDFKYVDPDENYDDFCKMNKENEMRRSLSTFLMNLTSIGMMKSKSLITLMTNILNMVDEWILLPDKTNEVNELLENVIAMYDKTILKKDKSGTVVMMLKKYGSAKNRDYPSLGSKSIFKCMDVLGV